MPSLGRVLERLTVAVDGDTSDAERKLHGLSDESKGGSWIGKLGAGAARAAGLMAVGVGVGAAAMGGLGLAAAASSEQSTIAFTSIMGDAGKAKTFLADLNTFAAQTPFELPGLRDSASRLLAVGTEANKVIPIMRTLGDSTSAMGTGSEGIERAVTALTQMQVKGKVTGEEMLQLAEAGVPAWDALATVLGTTVVDAQKRVSAGQVEASTLFTALETSAGPALQRVSGMMDKQSASFTGMLSTLKDTVSQQLGEAMTPALESIKSVMPGFTEAVGGALTSIGPQVGELASGGVRLLADLLPSVTPLIGVVAEVASALFEQLGPVIKELSPFIKEIAEDLGRVLVNALEEIGPALPDLAKAFGALVATLSDQGADGLSAVLKVAGPLVEAFASALVRIPQPVLTALVDAFIAFKVLGPVTALFSTLSAILPALGAGFTLLLGPVGLVVLAVAALAGIGYLIYKNWDEIAAFFDRIWEWIKKTFKTGIDGIVDFVKDLPGNIWDVITSIPEKLGKVGLLLVHVGKNLIGGLWNGVSEMWGRFWGFLTGLPGEILRSLGDAGGMLLTWGKNIVIGLWNGIVGMGKWLWDKVTGWIKDVIPGPIARALGMSSPSKVMAGLGVNAAEGLAQGILGGTGMVARASSALADAARPTLASLSTAPGGLGLAGGAGARGPVVQNVLQLPSGAIIPWSEVGRSVRVMFVDDGARNAFGASAG